MAEKTLTGQMLKKIRRQLGESQAAFARRFGVHQSTVHRWEQSGPPDLDPNKLRHILRTILDRTKTITGDIADGV
jgi:DNA-binding transcriptional regulator YiaG